MKKKKILGLVSAMAFSMSLFLQVAAEDTDKIVGTGQNTVSPEGETYYWSDEYKAVENKKIARVKNWFLENYGYVPQMENMNPAGTGSYLSGDIKKQNSKASGDVLLPTSQYVQETNYYCMVACSQILLEYITGICYTQTYLAGLMGTNATIGTYVTDAVPVINSLAGSDYAYTNNNYYYFWNNMVSNITNGFPVIYSVDPYYFYNGYTSCGHAVLGNGYNPDGTVLYWDVYPTFANEWRINHSDMSVAINANGGYYIW